MSTANHIRRGRRALLSVVSMTMGLSGVFGLLYFMNGVREKPGPSPEKIQADFQVKKIKKKKVAPTPKKRPKPKPVASVSRRAPTPNMGASLSGLSFDLPQFQGADLFGAESLLGSDKGQNLVMTAESLDTLPIPVSQKSPTYPASAIQKGIQGYVVLRLSISERGVVERVKVASAQPSGVFEDAAIAAVQQWTFEPGRYKGQAVPTQAIELKVPFQLKRS